MTTQLDTFDPGRLTVLPPAQRPADAAMAMLQSHAEMMDMAYSLAEKMCNTKLVPTRFFKKPEDATAAILYGLELGLNPIQSLQRVIPIHGMPTLEALTMVALIEPHGYTVKVVEETETVCEVHGWKPGKDPDVDKPDATSRWTIERAIKAGYVPKPASPESLCRPEVDDDWVTVTKVWDGKSKKSVVGNMKYITDPQSMLVAKGRTKVCKELAPHILLGIAASTEDMRSEQRFDDDEPRSTRVESTRGEPLTVNEVIGYDAAEAKSSGLGDKIQPATEPQRAAEPDPETENAPAEPAAEEKPTKTRRTRAKSKSEPADPPAGPAAQADSGQGGANDQGQGAEQSAGATSLPDSGDQEPAAEPKPKTAMRKALENRLWSLFNGIPALIGDPARITREERIAIYKDVLGRDDITSTDDLDNVEVAKVSDELFKMGQEGSTLVDLINEVRNAIAIAQAAAGGE